MGIFDIFRAYNNVGQINSLLKEAEEPFVFVVRETHAPTPDKMRLRLHTDRLSYVVEKIVNVAEKSSRSVQLAPYWFRSEKMNLPVILAILHTTLTEVNNIMSS